MARESAGSTCCIVCRQDRFSCRVSFTKADPVDPETVWALVTVTRVMRLFSWMVRRRYINAQRIGLSQLWNLNVIDSLLVAIFSRAVCLCWVSFKNYYEWQECACDFWEHHVKSWCTEHVVSFCLKNEQSLSCMLLQLLDLHPSCLCNKNRMAPFIFVLIDLYNQLKDRLGLPVLLFFEQGQQPKMQESVLPWNGIS